MAVTLRVARHSISASPVEIVEVLLDGKVVATIYPKEEGMMIVSAHFKSDIEDELKPNVMLDDGRRSRPPIPTVTIDFSPRYYNIVGGKLVFIEPKGN